MDQKKLLTLQQAAGIAGRVSKYCRGRRELCPRRRMHVSVFWTLFA
mgnify:CR=1 FL=1